MRFSETTRSQLIVTEIPESFPTRGLHEIRWGKGSSCVENVRNSVKVAMNHLPVRKTCGDEASRYLVHRRVNKRHYKNQLTDRHLSLFFYRKLRSWSKHLVTWLLLLWLAVHWPRFNCAFTALQLVLLSPDPINCTAFCLGDRQISNIQMEGRTRIAGWPTDKRITKTRKLPHTTHVNTRNTTFAVPLAFRSNSEIVPYYHVGPQLLDRCTWK